MSTVFALVGYLIVGYICVGVLAHAVFTPNNVEALLHAPRLPSGALAPANWNILTLRGVLRFLGKALVTGGITAQLLRSLFTNMYLLAFLRFSISADEHGNPALPASCSASQFVAFLEHLTLLPMDVKLALNNGTYTNEALRLAQIRRQLVMPFLHDVGAKGLLGAVFTSMVVSVLKFGTVVSTPEALQFGFRVAACLYVLRCVLFVLYYPLRSILRSVHAQIMDDNYLIGRTLVNNTVQVQTLACFVD